MGSLWKRASHGRRTLMLGALSGLPAGLLALILLWTSPYSGRTRWTLAVVVLVLWIWFLSVLRDHVTRPLGTLANMLAGLREGDFSIRARVAAEPDPDDTLSLVYMEANALEEMLREQRVGAVEASETLRKVLEAIEVAVFAFDPSGELRIVNRAAERLMGQPAERLLGSTATELRLEDALEGPSPRTLEVAFPGGTGRWEMRRSVVRQEGAPLALIALSDLSRALREEERQAWKRIIRVLSHEINNSLAPIKSISGSLRTLLGRGELGPDIEEDVTRGFEVISNRVDSLGQFMASYARLARLPPPEMEPVDVTELVLAMAVMETRTPVQVTRGPKVSVQADPAQLQQALINLIRNAADATLEAGGEGVSLTWRVRPEFVDLVVEDEGPGLTDTTNLFVPFYSTKPGGSGIGLVLTRQIAEAHGGSVVLENRTDHPGARAVMVIPAAAEA
jgi:PAS domain S-box-containing protein